MALAAPPLPAQQWNDPAVMTLIQRAVERRQGAQADSGLTAWRANAHGFVFFLAQVGQDFALPPKLIKADELDVEVYWRAPGQSKQIILGWRDGRFLPTDINYHRDHLGIVTNNFGDRIRIGEGDEVRDVIHPLSPAGLDAYDFALGDSLRVTSSGRRLTLQSVRIRPRSFAEPRVVGTLFIDAETAALVRFRFSFTPRAYLDQQLEDISVVLENALFEGRWWLPYRQDIEIRRRTSWLDFPARGIIRGRWEIGPYEFVASIPPTTFVGPAIGGLRQPQDTGGHWEAPLAQAIAGVAQPATQADLDAVRAEVERMAGAHLLSGLPSRRLAAGSVSDIAHVNRVQGLALGFGASLASGPLRIRPSLGYGTSDQRITGALVLGASAGGIDWSVTAARRVRDFSDLAVISGVVNSFTAQESGTDHGDYVLLEQALLGLRHRMGGHAALALEGGWERSSSVAVAATPARGTYRSNPALGAGSFAVARLRLERQERSLEGSSDWSGTLAIEAGAGPEGYARTDAQVRWVTSAGPGELRSRAYVGWGSDALPGYRSFALGGLGTLPGEPFRAYGGRRAALVHAEWRFDLPFPAIPLGTFASTGHTLTVAPFVAAGWTGSPIGGLPGAGSDGIRPVAGLALEWFMHLVRVEAGVGLRGGGFGLTVDVSREWWGIL
jgi:hypothetical protein